MEYVYLWEIDNYTRLGVSTAPSEELKLLESELQIRATRVFTARLTQSLGRAVRKLLGHKNKTWAGIVPLTFEQTKSVLIASVDKQ